MNNKTITGIMIALVLLSSSSCYLVNFEQEIDVEIIFDTRSARGEISVSNLFDINEYSSDFKEYKDHIEEIEIRSITGKLNEFYGPSDQVLSNGVLVISDQDGNGPETLALLPEVDLEELFISEQSFTMEEAGRQRLEELLLDHPNTCLGTFTGEVDQPPSDFVITFHIKAVIRGSLL
jgi:hypothetical protein